MARSSGGVEAPPPGNCFPGDTIRDVLSLQSPHILAQASALSEFVSEVTVVFIKSLLEGPVRQSSVIFLGVDVPPCYSCLIYNPLCEASPIKSFSLVI